MGSENLYSSTILGDIANVDYEGEIKDVGDSVVINTTPEITISDYEIGNNNGISYETPTSANVLLDINKAKYFGFKCNDIEEFQAKPALMDKFTADAGKRMGIEIDKEVLSECFLSADALNSGNSAGAISGNIEMGTAVAALTLSSSGAANTGQAYNIVDFLVNVGLVMDEQDVPDDERWIALPSALIAKIKTSELKDASLAGDPTSILRNGKVGMIDRLTLYRSNNVNKNVSNYYDVVAGHKMALTFASQMAKVEDLMNPNDFGKLVRGLNVFGSSVIQPKALVHARVNF